MTDTQITTPTTTIETNPFISRKADRDAARQMNDPRAVVVPITPTAGILADVCEILVKADRADLIQALFGADNVQAKVPVLEVVTATPTPIIEPVNVRETPVKLPTPARLMTPVAVRTPIKVPASSDNQDMIAPIQDGTYTLVYADGSPHFTFKIETPKAGSKLAGRPIVNYLAGSDNETDFRGFAFLNQNGSISVWNRFRDGVMVQRAADLEDLFRRPADVEQAGMNYALMSNRCRRCNHLLTVPASVTRGYGPTCIQYAGGYDFS